MNEIILLKSSDRTLGTSSDLNLTTAKILYGKYEIIYVSIYNTVYPVNSTNNIIYFNENATNKTATIPVGVYSTSGSNSILTAVGNALTTASGGFATFTATISSITNFITITSTQNFSLKLATNTSNSAYKIIGFTQTDTSAATTQTGSTIPNLSGNSSISLNIANISASWLGRSSGQILVPLDVGFGALKYYIKDNFCQVINFTRETTNISVKVCDTDGKTLDLNGSEWEVALRKIC